LSTASGAVVSILTRSEPDAFHEYLSAPSILPLVYLVNKYGFRYFKTNSVVSHFATHTFKRGGLTVVLHYFASNGRVGWELRNPSTDDVEACGITINGLDSILGLWVGGVDK